jgi:hypothetical protein
MDKPILIGFFLIVLTFVLWFTLIYVAQTNYNFYISSLGIFTTLTWVTVASFPIGSLIIVIRVMQWAKFQFHKGTLFGLFLIGLGFLIFVIEGQLTANNYVSEFKFLNEYLFVTEGAFVSILVGILILGIKTALWGSKYIGKSATQN